MNEHLWVGFIPLPIQVNVQRNEDGQFAGQLIQSLPIELPSDQLPFPLDSIVCAKCEREVIEAFGSHCAI